MKAKSTDSYFSKDLSSFQVLRYFFDLFLPRAIGETYGQNIFTWPLTEKRDKRNMDVAPEKANICIFLGCQN